MQSCRELQEKDAFFACNIYSLPLCKACVHCGTGIRAILQQYNALTFLGSLETTSMYDSRIHSITTPASKFS